MTGCKKCFAQTMYYCAYPDDCAMGDDDDDDGDQDLDQMDAPDGDAR